MHNGSFDFLPENYDFRGNFSKVFLIFP